MSESCWHVYLLLGFHACLWKLPYSVATQNVGAGERKVGEEETERMLEGRKPPLFCVPPASSSSLAFLSLALASWVATDYRWSHALCSHWQNKNGREKLKSFSVSFLPSMTLWCLTSLERARTAKAYRKALSTCKKFERDALWNLWMERGVIWHLEEVVCSSTEYLARSDRLGA